MSTIRRVYDTDRATLWHGDALALLDELPADHVDAVITDPPYSSGGFTRGDRTADPGEKYLQNGYSNRDLADFAGDNRDQRGFLTWCTLWMGQALRITRPGGLLLTFTDWRQLPTMTDAVQAGGWVWRGIVPWAKTIARPQPGRFTASCEYVVWASRGPLPIEDAGTPLPGFYTGNAPRDRVHQTEKPIDVMRQLVRIVPKHGTVLDPFAGSGTTGVAALTEGRRFLGCEVTGHYATVAAERLAMAERGYRDDGEQLALEEVTP